MVNVGARFRGRRVALPAGRSVSAMLTSDDGDVRALFQQEPKIKKCAGYENMDDSAFPLLCRFLDAGMPRLSARSCSRRPKSAKARNGPTGLL